MKSQLINLVGTLPNGCFCANCQDDKKVSVMPLYNKFGEPAIALVFLCNICILAAREGTLSAELRLQFVGI